MTENEAIEALKLEGGIEITGRPIRLAQFFEGIDSAIKALEEVQQYHKIGSVEKCIKNKDFLDFLSDKMNPNDFETYLRLYIENIYGRETELSEEIRDLLDCLN